MTCFNYTTWVRIDTVRLYHFYVLFIYFFYNLWSVFALQDQAPALKS